MSLSVTTKDDQEYLGYEVRQTAEELVLRDLLQGREVRLRSEMIKQKKPHGSVMPSGLTDALTRTEFRDLVLQPSEQHLAIPQIEAFLSESGLTYRGFLANGETLAAFMQAYPGEPWPGTLAHWYEFEQKNPTLFEGMYQLWCEKAG